MSLLRATFALNKTISVLDIGGTTSFWGTPEARITLLNIRPPDAHMPDEFVYVQGDARRLPFADGAFDLAFSNSAIEHLGNQASQEAMAREVRRVGRDLWVQTPSLYFPIEPHYLTPFVHWLPRRIRRRVLRRFSIWGLITRPPQSTVDASVEEIRLLTFRQMQALFPDCVIHRERFLFMTKSLIAIRRHTPTVSDGNES